MYILVLGTLHDIATTLSHNTHKLMTIVLFSYLYWYRLQVTNDKGYTSNCKPTFLSSHYFYAAYCCCCFILYKLYLAS